MLKRAFFALDRGLGQAKLYAMGEGGGLITVMFHSLFADRAEIELGHIDPQQRTTVADFRAVVQCFQTLGYHFTTPAEVLAGLDPRRRYVMLTFDDGYFNNLRALPVLQAHCVPAVFFITANHVLHNKCMWSDVLYRERTHQGHSLAQIRAEQESLKHLRSFEIEQHLRSLFGQDSFQPLSDLDRFMTPAELRQFADNEWVVIGNHTQDHAILTNYTLADVRREVAACQQSLADITGSAPESIAYPNGNYSPEIVRVCQELGLRLGIGVFKGKNYLPLPQGGEMALLRFTFWGDRALPAQIATFRRDSPLWKWWQGD